MFKWLKDLFKIELVIHVDGDLRLHHDGLGAIVTQGPQNVVAPAKDSPRSGGTNTSSEGDIGPELFTDLGTPEVGFGRDVELPPTGRKAEDNKIS